MISPSDPRWRESLVLFNERKYFESHEVLESLWLEVKGDPNRNLYKGVIQAAAALYQLRRGRHSGAVSLCATSVKYLEAYAPEALGLDVGGLIREMRRAFGDGKKAEWDEALAPRAAFR